MSVLLEGVNVTWELGGMFLMLIVFVGMLLRGNLDRGSNMLVAGLFLITLLAICSMLCNPPLSLQGLSEYNEGYPEYRQGYSLGYSEHNATKYSAASNICHSDIVHYTQEQHAYAEGYINGYNEYNCTETTRILGV